jgi:predicted nucleic acid-binding protein
MDEEAETVHLRLNDGKNGRKKKDLGMAAREHDGKERSAAPPSGMSEKPSVGDTKRNITLDSNVIIGHAISKDDTSLLRCVVVKCVSEDIPMLTDAIVKECLCYTRKADSKISYTAMKRRLSEISSNVIELEPISEEELEKRYRIRAKKDLIILHSAEVTGSVIIITQDHHFNDVEGVKAKIMHPKEYLYEKREKQ